MKLSLFVPLAVVVAFASAAVADPVSIFDGKTFTGWEGDTAKTWRIEDGAIVAGSLEEMVPHNEFLATKKSYGDFDLHVKYKITGTEGFVNGGVQFRSERIPNHFEMIGYQADLGAGYDGALYDESRRKRMLEIPNKETLAKILKIDDWNDYRIRAEGRHIQLWINGVQTVDYIESEEAIEETGFIAVQVHGSGKTIVCYKDLVIEELGVK